MSQSYELDADVVHYAWDHSLEPRLTIDPGDTVTFHTRDAADNFYSIDSTAEDVIRKGPFKGHPLTGFQLPTSSICSVAPRAMSFNRESPRQMTILPGGGSLVRAR